jgi:pyruvate-formate lyase-activating enzyme
MVVTLDGGEPFLYYAALRCGVEMASDAGFRVGVVSNAYWATVLGLLMMWGCGSRSGWSDAWAYGLM